MDHPSALSGILNEDRVFQGPMAGYSDRAFRHVMIEHGCALTTTEMVSVEGLARDQEKTFGLLRLADNELPERLIVQLFGANPSAFEKAVDRLLKLYRPFMIDVNAGCSVKKVVKTGAGVALMSDAKRIRAIVKAIRSAGEGIRVSVKMRLGLSDDSINCIDFAKSAIDAGASLVTLHPRTASQGFSGSADHAWTRKLKEAVGEAASVVASGDVTDPEEARALLLGTGCDAVMVARAAVGNPFFFEGLCKWDVPDEDRREALLGHCALLARYEGHDRAKVLARKFVKPYLSGIKGVDADGILRLAFGE